MTIPDHLIEQVRLQADIVEIVSEHTRLKRSGRTFRGPCPLHGGEGPNFSVDPAKGFYKCFVCGEGGTVFTFLMKQTGMTYPEAVRSVAERVGIEIPDPREERREADPNQRLYDVNAFAADWFRRQLRGEAEGARKAREYLARRGITEAAIDRFGVGWAPEEWSALREAANAHGIDDERLLALGLAKEPKHGTRPYDAFRGRIIFPIEDLGGRVVAFGGRILGEAGEHAPKYLNSPESEIYHKGRMLYGLGWSRGAIRKAEVALVVEGYMDYVSLAAHGVENAVAPLGTAMTEEQAELLAKYAPRVILLYDSDKAGLKATFRAGDELLRAGVEVLVATLPEGEDPDSLVRAKGEKALRRYLDDAVDVLERKVQILERKGFFTSIAGTRKAVDSLLPTIRAATDELLRGVYVGRVAEKTGIPRETLDREVAAAPARGARAAAPEPDRRRRPQHDRRAQESGFPVRATEAEKWVLFSLLHNEALIDEATRRIGVDDFTDPVYREIYQLLLEIDGQRDPDWAWVERLSPGGIAVVEGLRGLSDDGFFSAMNVILRDSLQHLETRSERAINHELKKRAETAPPEEREAILARKVEVTYEQAKTGRGRIWGVLHEDP